jgi:hypothetical protein
MQCQDRSSLDSTKTKKAVTENSMTAFKICLVKSPIIENFLRSQAQISTDSTV